MHPHTLVTPYPRLGQLDFYMTDASHKIRHANPQTRIGQILTRAFNKNVLLKHYMIYRGYPMTTMY